MMPSKMHTRWARISFLLAVSVLLLLGQGQAHALSTETVDPAQRATPTPTPRGVSGGLGNAAVNDATDAAGDFAWVETDFFSAILPAGWIDSEQELDEGEGTFTFTAAPDLADLQDLAGDQGVILVLQATAERVDPTEVLDSVQTPSDTCTLAGEAETVHTFSSVPYDGLYYEWRECPQADGSLFGLVLQSDEVDAVIFVLFLAPTADDARIFDIFRNTLAIRAAPPFDAPVRPSTPPTREQPTPTPIPAEPAVTDDIAIVVTDRLNVRRGPGTNYERVGAVEQGDALEILGRNADCSWLNIVTEDGLEGWVSASAQYVSFGARCDSLPLATIPDPPTPAPTATPIPPASQGSAPTDPTDNPNLGCYLFENQIGTEVTITFTRRNSTWNITFRVPSNGAEVRCFEPGDYTYTLDAPPPWDSVNGDLRVVAGERLRFPIQAE